MAMPAPAYTVTYDDARVRPILVGTDVTWAASLRAMLEAVGSDYVILMLEDFLLTALTPVGATA